MTKQESTQAKGLAILLMLFLHLFNLDDSFVSLVNVGSIPLVRIMARACNPVAFYLILGGMGLYIVWEKGHGTVLDNAKRILRLYSHYWVILILFVTVGYFINSAKYPGGG